MASNMPGVDNAMDSADLAPKRLRRPTVVERANAFDYAVARGSDSFLRMASTLDFLINRLHGFSGPYQVMVWMAASMIRSISRAEPTMTFIRTAQMREETCCLR